jgi:hypothetical protein
VNREKRVRVCSTQVLPSGVGPSLIRVSARPGATDRALNPVQLTGESEYTVYFGKKTFALLFAFDSLMLHAATALGCEAKLEVKQVGASW